MKKLLSITVLLGMLVFAGCEDTSDDVEPKKKCLVCEGSAGDTLCEGDIDPDSGQEVTLELLEISRDLLNAFGGNCTLKNK